MTGPRRLLELTGRLVREQPGLRRLSHLLPSGLRGIVLKILRQDPGQRDPAILALLAHTRSRRLAACRAHSAAWERIGTVSEWESFRDAALEGLRASLGMTPPFAPAQPKPRITRVLAGEGFRIENTAFESRPGLTVTANVYVPETSRQTGPGILICHSHHNPKSQTELQVMGTTWARQGCVVLIMDQLGHGERRQHPFDRVERQDYYFRHNIGIQLDLIGESLIGWMVRDLTRGIDLLSSRGDVDGARILLIGSVAGGGDPAAVAAALDPRVAAVVPFGFGRASTGESGIDFAGPGSWESTRNLRSSVRDGFLPWVILGAVAPRRLVYAHEFAWDSENDPVWTRLRRIYDFYDVPDRLAAIHGSGSVAGHSPGDTHCNNVGTVHRRQLYPLLERWFGIPPPETEAVEPRPEQDLECLVSETGERIHIRPVHQLASELAGARLRTARERLRPLSPIARRERLRADWARILGDIDPETHPQVPSVRHSGRQETTVLRIEDGSAIPLILLLPDTEPATVPAVVVGVAQAGGRRILRQRAEFIADLRRQGVAVCLPDLRGVGDYGRGDVFRGRTSLSAQLSSNELMLGQTLLGARLRDLRSVLRYLRAHPGLKRGRVALWGDSLADVNPAGRPTEVPYDAEPFPEYCEPLGGLLALLGALFEEEVGAVYARGGLTDFASVLDSPFCFVPHDVIVPGALAVGDLPDIASALAPTPLRIEATVDGRNRNVGYADADRSINLPGSDVARWIAASLREDRSGRGWI